ncbi:MAG: hypothetical protein DBX45_02510 [Oscillospiraceae bacterium]|nr:MAG: hypothetical protein DBX45_02510 [Oscillospiraceae bacterium]
MSDEREPNNRSDAALRERLEIAGKAAEGPWQTNVIPPEMVGFRPRYVIRDEKGIVIVEEVHHFASWQKTGQHIAASSPDVVRADIEEILRLRQEVARLEDTLAHLVSRSICQTVEGWWSAHGEKFQTKKEAMQHVITKAEDEMKEAARKAVEEEERHG